MENHGFKFRPTHQECILYLCLKVTASPFPDGVTIPDRNPYNLQELAGIFLDAEKYGDFYFFTKLTSKGKTGTNNVNRTVGEGTWHGNTIKKVYHNGRKLGKYTKLSYQEEGNSIYHRRFSMTEYTLLKNTKIMYDPFQDYVLCHLEKNERWINGKRVSKLIRESMSNEIIADHIPGADEAHHVTAVDSMELPSDQTTHDVQAQAVEETAAGFENFETLTTPTATLAPISDHDFHTQCSSQVGSELVPFQDPTPAAESNYSVVEAPLHAFDETHVAPPPYYPPAATAIPYQNSVNRCECVVGSELIPLQTPIPASESNYYMGDEEFSHLLAYIYSKPPAMEAPLHTFDQTYVGPLGYDPASAAIPQTNCWPDYSFQSEAQQVYSQIPQPASQDDDGFVDSLLCKDHENYCKESSSGNEATDQRQLPVMPTSTNQGCSPKVS